MTAYTRATLTVCKWTGGVGLAGAFSYAIATQPAAATLAGAGFAGFAIYALRYGRRHGGGTEDRILSVLAAVSCLGLTANAWGLLR